MEHNFLFQIGNINIDFSTIISFLLGAVMGFIILLLVYALAVVSSIRTKNFITKTQEDDLTTQEVKDMVSNTQRSYKDKTLRGDQSRVPYCYGLCKDLAYGIAVRFYPTSKHPFLELSINEITLLTGYITERVDEILNHRGIRMLRKLKVSTIVSISTKKKEVEESKAFQTTMVISQNLNKMKYVLNVLNPLNWGRKLIVDRIMNIVVDQICLVIISIVGEETYKIYSKKVFHKEVEIDTGSNEFIEEMTDKIKTAAMELDIAKEAKPADVQFKTRVWMGADKKMNYVTFHKAQPLKKSMEVAQE